MLVTKDPPIVELVMSLSWEPIPGVSIIDLAELYQRFAPDYPSFQQVPPAPPLQVTPFAAPVQFEMVTGTELPRVWFISSDGHRLVQFQTDRLVQNWRRMRPLDAPAPEYPGYEAVRETFASSFRAMSAWAKERGLPQLTLRASELSYINAVPLMDGDKMRRISEVVAFYSPSSSAPVVNWNSSWWEQVPDLPAFANVVTTAGHLPEGTPAVTLTISTRSDMQGMDLESALARFDLLHDRIHEIFGRVLRPEFVERARR